MRRVLICLIIALSATVAVGARVVELTLQPAQADVPTQEYKLLPRADKQTDADAVPLYEQAIEAMPKGRKAEKQIREWLELPVEQLPLGDVEEALQKHTESLRLAARAARCKECKWPQWNPGTTPPDTSGFRRLTFLLRLWARWEIVRGGHDGALLAMQTGFAMGRHLGQAPTMIQVQVAMAVGGAMCKEIEQFMQAKDSPNLYWAIANLPRPLADVEKSIENERANLKDRNLLVRRQLEKVLKPAHDRMRMMTKRLDTNLNALQCVEALRHYAASHDGRLPEQLSDISDVDVPKDLLAGKAFEYSRNATGAVLQSAVPKDGDSRDAVRYEIVLKK
ncbi:MAG: hypothetical protein ACYTAO_19920 [Planctomycetota bacterium]|jgi:hypothetical protein